MNFNWLDAVIQEFFAAPAFSDKMGVVGLLVTLAGFVYSGVQSQKAKKAARLAVEKIGLLDGVASLSSAMEITAQIKKFQRLQAWEHVPDLCSRARVTLSTLRAEHPELTADQKSKIQSAISNFAKIEETIELVLSSSKKGQSSLDVPKWNRLLSKNLDDFAEITALFRQKDKK